MPLPTAADAPREPFRRRRHPRPLRPRQRHGRPSSPATPTRSRGARERACVPGTQSPPPATRSHSRRFPAGRRTRTGVRPDQGVHPRRRRVPGRPLAAGRAADRASALDLYRALRRVNPSPYLFLLELDGLALIGSSPETLVKCEGGAREPEPDRGHDQPGEGDAERAARVGEGPGRARDARRPRPERPLARLPGGHRPRRALPRAGAVLARHPPRLGGDRRAAGRRDAVRSPPRVLPRRNRLRGAEGARDADRLGARGPPPRPVRRRGRLRAPGRHAGHVHRDPDDRPRTTASRGCRRARGSWQTPIRAPSTGSA